MYTHIYDVCMYMYTHIYVYIYIYSIRKPSGDSDAIQRKPQSYCCLISCC